MRLRIGNQSWMFQPGPRGQGQFKQKIRQASEHLQQEVLDGVTDVVVRTSPGLLRDLMRRIESRTFLEAIRIFERMIFVMENTKAYHGPFINKMVPKAITSHKIDPAMDQFEIRDPGLRQSFTNGNVPWRALSQRWHKYKVRRFPRQSQKFFVASGNLKGQLRRNKKTWVRSRFGGIEVRSKKAEARRGRITERTTDVAVGDLHINIFPKVTSRYLPGLAARRWALVDFDGGDLERSVLPGKTAEKLAGAEGFHRPLLQPVMQYFILHRIPRAIRRAIDDWIKNSANVDQV